MFLIKKIYILVLLSISYSSVDFMPLPQAVLNYTSIFFKWPQINEYGLYKIYIYNNSSNDTTYMTNKNSIIIDDFEWGGAYSWKVCASDNLGNEYSCYETFSFSVSSLPQDFPNTSINVFDNLNTHPGITVLDFETSGYSVALSLNGAPIWFTHQDYFPVNKILVTQVLDNGNFLGFGNGRGYEFNINSDVIFETPSDYGVHHQIFKTNKDTYFLIDADFQDNPCPNSCNSNFPDLITWQGDRFIELDFNGEKIWEWNTFDYLALNEYNPLWINNCVASGCPFDWTHSNSVFYESGSVFISMRNLSRISAIEYTSKDILWSIGNSDFMDQLDFSNNLGFSHQHSAQITFDGNLIFFDNGRNNVPELSRCLEVAFVQENDPQIVWEHFLSPEMTTLSRGECDKLLNGNALISAGRTGNVIEVSENNDIVWHLSVTNFNNNSPIAIYRSERVPSLYANSFSIIANGLSGIYGSYFLDSSTIDLTVYNLGWENQDYKYELISEENQIIVDGNLNVSNNSFTSLLIDVSNLENQDYNINVHPINNKMKKQTIRFTKNINLLADVNLDGLVNVSDIVLMIELILSNQFSSVADINSDNNVNISDIVLTINLILQR